MGISSRNVQSLTPRRLSLLVLQDLHVWAAAGFKDTELGV